MKEQWLGFKEGNWVENIDVRDFILQNYTVYTGDENFLAKPTTATKKLMKMVEAYYPGIKKIKLDTPLWNLRTNAFYTKLGYREVKRDKEFAYYQKECD